MLFRSALFRKRLQATDNYRPDTSVEEEQLKRAQHRIAEANERLEACKKWRRRLDQCRNEYQGSAGNLADLVSGEPPASVVEMKRILLAIENYRKLQGPGAIDFGFPPLGAAQGGMANPTAAAAPADALSEAPAAPLEEVRDGP